MIPRSPLARAVAVTCLLLALALGGFYGWKAWLDDSDRDSAIGGEFALTDQRGQLRHASDFKGQYLLVYFGYTHCPDLCPTALTDMSNAIDKLGKKGEKVTPIFVTVDPKRDTVAALADYAKAFHPRLVALTGTEADVRALAKSYRVFYDRAKNEGDPQAQSDYLIDHSSVIFVMDDEGEYLQLFQSGYTADTLAQALEKLL